MKAVRYSKYEATLEDLDSADLMRMLQDRLLASGFDHDPWDPDPNARPTLDDLYEMIAEALLEAGLVDESLLDAAMEADDWRQSELGRLVRSLAERLERDGYLRPGDGDDPHPAAHRDGRRTRRQVGALRLHRGHRAHLGVRARLRRALRPRLSVASGGLPPCREE